MKKFYLDITLLLLFMLVMSFHFIPKILHEVLGLVMFAAMSGHFIWNRRAFTSLFRGNKLSMLIDVAMLIVIVTIIVTGVCISNHLFNGMIDMNIQRNITIHQLHVSLPYALLILSGLHLGLHWQGFYQRMKSIITIPSIIGKIIAALLIAAGIYGSFLNRVGDRLMMGHIFATDATQLPFGLFVLLMIGIFAIYVAIGIFIQQVKRKL